MTDRLYAKYMWLISKKSVGQVIDFPKQSITCNQL